MLKMHTHTYIKKMCGRDPLSCIFDQKNFNDKFLMLEEEENFLETHFDFFSSHAGSTESLQQEGMKSSEEIDTMVSRITRQENTGSAKEVHVPHLEQPMSLASGKVLVNAEKPGLGRSVIPVNAASDSDSCSLFEYVPQNKNRLKTF